MALVACAACRLLQYTMPCCAAWKKGVCVFTVSSMHLASTACYTFQLNH